jgi:coenzyme F420-reducing hydrogenase gamma subunit
VCGACKYRRNTGGPTKDKQGTLLTTEKEHEERWAEHFCEVQNRPSPEERALIQYVPDVMVDLDINTDPPTRDKIIDSIKALENGKSPGCDKT